MWKRAFAVACLVLNILTVEGVPGRLLSRPDIAAASASAGAQESNPVGLAINSLVALVTLVAIFPLLRVALRFVLRTRWLLWLYMLEWASIMWEPEPVAAFKNCCYLLVPALAAVVIAVRLEVNEIAAITSTTLFAIAVASPPAEFIIPRPLDPYGMPFDIGWVGAALDKNAFGLAMALGIIVVFYEAKRWTWLRMCKLTFFVPLLFLSRSTTALFCSVAGVLVVLYMRASRRIQGALLLLGGATVIAMLLFPDLIGDLLATQDKSTDLTGRSEIWAVALAAIAQKPLLGWGVLGFWANAGPHPVPNMGNPGQSHNGFIEMATRFGIIGLIALIYGFVLAGRLALRTRALGYKQQSYFLLLIGLVLMVHNISESDFMQLTLMWFMFLIAVLRCVYVLMLNDAPSPQRLSFSSATAGAKRGLL